MKLHERFDALATSWLTGSEVVHEWDRSKNGWRFLSFEPVSDERYHVQVNACDDFIYVILDHELVIQFDSTADRDDQNARDVVTLLACIFDGHVRLRVELAKGKPFRWTLEAWHGTSWTATRTTRRMLRGWGGNDAERILTNRVAGSAAAPLAE